MIPHPVLQSVRTLQSAGYLAYLVGGCVRDMILKRTPKDWDVATNATPEQVLALFPSGKLVGKKFGVVNVNYMVEVATFRRDGVYEDGRRPESVNFVGTSQEDSLRRDFTMNAIYYDPFLDEYTDHHGGREDIKSGIVRCVGMAQERFREDTLRILRAVRFAAQLNFRLHPYLVEIIKTFADDVPELSVERVRDELVKTLLTRNRAYGLELLMRTNILTYTVPEVANCWGVEQPMLWHPEGDVFQHTKLLLFHLGEDVSTEEVWAALLHDIGKPKTRVITDGKIQFPGHAELGSTMAHRILTRLRFPNDLIDTITWMVANHMKMYDGPEMRPARLKRLMGDFNFPFLLNLCRADELGSCQDPTTYKWFKRMQEKLSPEFMGQVLPPRFVTGKDLIDMGLEPGPNFRVILESVYDRQLEEQFPDRNAALEYTRTLVNGNSQS